MASVLSNLAPALLQTFLTILVGYAFGRSGLLPAEGVRAMGVFVTMLSLPALLLRNMITLDLRDVHWTFFSAMLIGKAILFAATALLVILRHKGSKRAFSDAGCFAIFVTQSNDFAMGLPILTALFAGEEETKNFPMLLYVIAPISLALLNPIGFFLLEMGRETQALPPETTTITTTAAEAEGTHASTDTSAAHVTVVASTGSLQVSPAPSATAASTASASPRSSRAAAPSYRPPTPSRLALESFHPMGGAIALTSPNSPSVLASPLQEHDYPGMSVDSILAADSSSDEGEEEDEEENAAAIARARSASPPIRDTGMPLLDVTGTGSSLHPPPPRAMGAASPAPLLSDGSPSPVSPDASTAPSPSPSHSPSPPTSRLLLNILYRVLTNPVVLCTLLGLLLNFALSRQVPDLIDSFLASLGSCFTSLALFVLGVGMNGKLGLFQEDRSKLAVPLLLIMAKSVALPVIVRLIMGVLGVDGADPLSLCAFLVGTFPTAPSVPFFAQDSDAYSKEIVAPAMVLGTFIAAPIMFVSAQMVTVALTSHQINRIVSDTTRIAAGSGFLAAAACFTIMIYNGRRRSVREKLLLTCVALQACYTAGVQWCVADLPISAEADVRFWLVMGSQFGVWVWGGLMGLNEVVRKVHGVRAEAVCYKYYNIGGGGVILALLGGLSLFGQHPEPMADLQFCACWFRYGEPQHWIIMFLLGTCICLTLLSLVTARMDASLDPSAAPDTQPHIHMDMHHELTAQLLLISPEQSVNGASIRSAYDGSRASASSSSSSARPHSDADAFAVHASADPPAPGVGAVRRIAIDVPDVHGPPPAPPQSDSVSRRPRRRRYRAAAVHMRASEEERFWLQAMSVWLTLMCASMMLSMALYAWSKDTNGTRVEMQLLDAVLFATAAVYTLFLFATAPSLRSPIQPLTQWVGGEWRKWRAMWRAA